MSAKLPFVCIHGDPRCEDDPCPAGIQWLCDAPADHPARAEAAQRAAEAASITINAKRD